MLGLVTSFRGHKAVSCSLCRLAILLQCSVPSLACTENFGEEKTCVSSPTVTNFCINFYSSHCTFTQLLKTFNSVRFWRLTSLGYF